MVTFSGAVAYISDAPANRMPYSGRRHPHVWPETASWGSFCIQMEPMMSDRPNPMIWCPGAQQPNVVLDIAPIEQPTELVESMGNSVTGPGATRILWQTAW